MTNFSHADDYQNLLADIKSAIRSGRNKAIRQLSRAVIESYWDIGRRILESQQRHGWGKGIVEQLARDLQREFPGTEGFSARNLWNMRLFYETYGGFPNLQQRVAEIAWGHSKPIGVAEYQLLPELPENLIGFLPSPDEIKTNLGNI